MRPPVPLGCGIRFVPDSTRSMRAGEGFPRSHRLLWAASQRLDHPRVWVSRCLEREMIVSLNPRKHHDTQPQGIKRRDQWLVHTHLPRNSETRMPGASGSGAGPGALDVPLDIVGQRYLRLWCRAACSAGFFVILETTLTEVVL